MYQLSRNFTITLLLQRDSVSSINSSHGEIPSSPSIGRRRKLSAAPGTLNTNPSNPINPKAQPRSAESPIGISSPKYFPKQKVLEITGAN